MTTDQRRTYWDDSSGIHIPLFRAGDPARLWGDVETAASESGLTAEIGKPDDRVHIGKPDDRVHRRSYRPPRGLRAFGVSISQDAPAETQVTIFPAFDAGTDEREADIVADFASRLSSLLEPPIARSFSVMSENGHIKPDEVEGPLCWIDWWQYLGANIVDRTGRNKLESLPLFQVTGGPRGALVLRATRSPNEAFRRKPLAAQLGIQLKPWRDWHPETQTWSEREWPL